MGQQIEKNPPSLNSKVDFFVIEGPGPLHLVDNFV